MQIGIIGAGAIASYLLEQAGEHEYEVRSVFVRDKEKYAHLTESYPIKLYDDFTAFLQSPIDLVVEAATVEVVQENLLAVLQEKDAMIISIGAFVDEAFFARAKEMAKAYGKKLYLPSGAIGGLDLVQNVLATKTVDEVTLTTRKPAHTLTDERLEEATLVFDDCAKAAIEKYPRNMNVSIALSLAGIGFEQTRVQLIADPKLDKNIHQIKIHGAFGEATFTIANHALPSNPNSSYLAAISIIGTLSRINDRVKIS